MITKESLIVAFEKAKILKSDIILISYNKIYGSNKEYTIIEEYDSDINFGFQLSYLSKDMAKFIKYINDNPNGTLICNETNLIYQDSSIIINNSFGIWKIESLYQIFSMHCNQNSLLKSIDNLYEYMGEDNPYTKKTSEKSVVKIDSFVSVIYGKILPSNKSDRVSLDIFRMFDNTLIYRYIIDKKKKGKVIVYMACLNLY